MIRKLTRLLIILLLIVGCENGGFVGDYTCVLNTAENIDNNNMLSNAFDTLTISATTMHDAISRCQSAYGISDSRWCPCTREYISF